MHHIIVTTLVNSEYQRMNEDKDHAVHRQHQSLVMAGIRSVTNRMAAILQANRGTEPCAMHLEQCHCTCQPSRS